MMKKILLLLTLVVSGSTFFAQSDEDIAKVYIDRAYKSAEELRYDESIEYFEKALKRKDTITKTRVAYLGMLIYFETKNYEEAHNYSKQYFLLTNNKKSEEYQEVLATHVTIIEKLEEIEEIRREEEEERLRKEKELARIDSLKKEWKQRASLLSFKADSIFPFNKNNLAIYQEDNSYGIIDDTGSIIVEANEYKNATSFDGYFILMNKEENPTKIFTYDTNAKEGFLLPKASEFNVTSTNYGKVMLPRLNGKIVTYPNNSLKTFVYDLKEKSFSVVDNQKDLFKALRKTDKIDRSNNDGQVKIEGEWYNFGGHLGGGIHPLYNDDFSLHGYLFSVNGNVVTASQYSNLGFFNDEKIQAISNGKTVWLDQNANEVSDAANKLSNYAGLSIITRNEDGNYLITQEGIIILGEKKLEKMVDFIKANSPE